MIEDERRKGVKERKEGEMAGGSDGRSEWCRGRRRKGRKWKEGGKEGGRYGKNGGRYSVFMS